MKNFVLILVMLFTSMLAAQTIDKFSIDSGGDNVASGDLKLLFTIGEVNVQELSNGNISVSAGFITSPFSTLSLDDEVLHNLTIYPNPAISSIFISSSLELQKVELYNILGKKVVETIQTTQLDVSQLASGLYMLNVYFQDGRKVIKKIIIQNK